MTTGLSLDFDSQKQLKHLWASGALCGLAVDGRELPQMLMTADDTRAYSGGAFVDTVKVALEDAAV